MKKRLLITTVFLALWLSLQSQELNKIELIKPSAQTASLGEYGNLKISKSTGLLNLSIPIYNIEAGNISVPISLSYNSSGVKLSDIASWVGLKWSLNAGGVICRTVVGGEDQICSFDTETKNLKNTKIEDLNFDKVYSATVHNDNLEPDIYNYNFLGYTGKFVLDDDGKVVICGQPNVKIEYTNTNGFKWIVYTSNGYKLIFSSSEINRVISKSFTKTKKGLFSSGPDSENTSIVTSAWYLDEIIDVKTQEKVKFHYQHVRGVNESYNSWISYDLGNTFGHTVEDPLDKSYTWLKRISNTPILDSITFLSGKVIFKKDFGRKDFTDKRTGCSLKSIEIINDSNKLIDKYKINTSYDCNRLVLSGIDKIDNKGNNINYYSFKYEGSLPDRDSPARDYWGYYNGRDGNKYHFPKIRNNEGDDWEPDSKCMKGLILYEIKYPTGGKSYISYEANDYSKDLNGNKVISNKRVRRSKKIHNTFKDGVECANYKTKWDTLILNATHTVGISNSFDDRDLILQIRKPIQGGSEFVASFENGYHEKTLNSGKYLIGHVPGGFMSDSWDELCYFTDIFYYEYSKVEGNKICGGLRVSSIREENGFSIRTKDYSYKINNSNLSSGIYSNPEGVSSGVIYIRNSNGGISSSISRNFISYDIIQSNYTNMDQLLHGSTVEYSEVKESVSNNGCIISKFSTILDYPDYHYNDMQIGKLRTYGYKPYINTTSNNNSWKRGNLLEEIYYNSNNEKILQNKYVYDFNEIKNIHGRKLSFLMPPSNAFTPWENYNKISICDYDIRLGYTRLKKQETTKYSNVNSVLTKEIEYNQLNGEISSEKIILNGVEKQKNLYLYPDKTNADHSALINNNLFWDLVGVYKEKSNKKVSGARNIYNKTIHPMSRERLNKYGTYSAKQSFKYEEGMVVEIRNNNTYTCVIKDKYNQIIAYIQNAKILEVKNKLGSTKYSYIRNNSATSRTYQYINELKQKLPNSSIYTFEYIPLIGIVNEIDANGKNTRYSYDTFNRLSSIKDFNGNLVKSYKYNYKR